MRDGCERTRATSASWLVPLLLLLMVVAGMLLLVMLGLWCCPPAVELLVLLWAGAVLEPSWVVWV
jgi:hypothetical protein